jgi:predicted GTPase
MALAQAGLPKRWKGLPDGVHRPYRRFLVNKLRENFNFKGVSIEIYVMRN